MQDLHRESPSIGFEVIEGGKHSIESEYEEKIEDRYGHLSGDLQHFVSSLQAACLAEHSPAREILEELAAKQGKLAWTIGVARRSEGAARRRMWPDIERLIGDLESTLRLLSHLQFVEGHWSVRLSAIPFDGAAGGGSRQPGWSEYDDIS